MPKTMKDCTSSACRPNIDFDLISNSISAVVTTVENACLQEGTMFLEKDRGIVYKTAEHYPFRLDCTYLGYDRAHMSLYGPLENIKLLFEDYKRQIVTYGLRAKYMSEVTLPWLSLQCPDIFTSEAKPLSKIRTALHENGRIDDHYVNSFAKLVHPLAAPMEELSSLIDLLTSICDEGDELFTPPFGSIAAPPSATAPTTALRTGSTPLRSSRSRATITESARSSHTIDLTPPTRSPYFPTPHPRPIPTPPPTPKWKLRLSSSLHRPLPHFSVHPPDITVFRIATSHARSALAMAESCIEACDCGAELAREMQSSWLEWMVELERGEERIEKEVGRGLGGGGDVMGGVVRVPSWEYGYR